MKLLKKLSKKKKIIAIIVIILLIIIVRIFSKSNATDENQIETENIERRSVAQSVAATGTVKTTNTKEIASTLTGSTIKTVNVVEGQKISAGDVICTFDMSTIEENLAQAKSSASTAAAQANLGIQSAQRNLSDAISNKDTQVSSVQSDLDTAKKAYDDAQNQLNTARNSLATLQAELQNITPAYTGAQANFAGIEAEFDSRQNAQNLAQNAYDAQLANFQNAQNVYNQYFNSAGNQIKPDGTVINPVEYTAGQYATEAHKNANETYQNAKASLAKAETDLNTAKSSLSAYKTTYDTANNSFWPIESQYQTLSTQIAETSASIATLESTVNNLKSTYDKAIMAYNSTVSTADSTIASMQDSVANSQLSAAATNQAQDSQIKAYEEQLEKGVVISNVSGTVTSVNVKTGDIYTGTSIAKIDGVEEFIIESEIDEYYIADIKEGMKVLIKTDSTRDEELTGRVIFVAVSPTSNALPTGATSSGNTTYTVKIALDNQNDRLRLGMNAKISIILDSKENVWTVPYDAVYEREDGTHYIEILKNNPVVGGDAHIDSDATIDPNSETEELNVTKGIEGTYYVEIISDKLTDGMKVVLPKKEASNSIEDLIEAMGADAGM